MGKNRKYDLTGRVFGRLEVLSLVGYINKHTMWLCRCSCGEERIVRQQNLLDGNSTSCGCYNRELTSKRKRRNIAGQRFGSLTALKDTGTNKQGAALWLCKCDCGNDKEVQGRNLRNGSTKSCGLCVVDVIGQTFGRWTVIGEVPREKGRSQVSVCECSCGVIREVATTSLVRGDSVSCGCYARDVAYKTNLLPNDEAQFRYSYRSYKKGAENRGLDWQLTVDELNKLVVQNCYYCGAKPSNIGAYRARKRLGDVLINGIDRVDNTKGYRVDNCVPCCKICNTAKRNMPIEQFIEWVDRLRTSQNIDNITDFKGYAKNNLVKALEIEYRF